MRQEKERVKRYLEEKMVDRLLDSLLQRLLLELPDTPHQFLVEELRRDGALVLISEDLPQSCSVKTLDFTCTSLDELKKFSMQGGTKIVTKFPATSFTLETLRCNKVFYDHVFHSSPLLLDLPAAVKIPAELMAEAVSVTSKELPPLLPQAQVESSADCSSASSTPPSPAWPKNRGTSRYQAL